MIDERNYWLAFSVFSGVGPIRFKMLLNQFGRAKDAWRATTLDLSKAIGEKLTEKFDKFRNTFSIRDYTRRLLAQGVSFIITTDKEYPKLLSQIKNPPFVLFVKGDTTTLYSLSDQASSENREVLSEDGSRQARTIIPTIAVVGTRRTTSYGREVTKILTEELVAAGFLIVSGLAIGIDTVSHKAAIEAGGKTIAVLGCGIDCCYPSANQSIYNSIIIGKGCVVSEYPLGQAPTRGSFPARNRIIAGLSLGVLVTEGAEDSGSLITAGYGLKFGRKVFAVPGPITSSLSKGPYKLIAKGARLVTSAEDILKEFKISTFAKAASFAGLRFAEGFGKARVATKAESVDKQNSKFKNATNEEKKILNILQNEQLHFDELVRRTGFESAKTGSILSIMEIKGMIKSLESGQFSISS